ncbi:MAG: serine hydrolase domain-containing protein [bacterium]
MTMRRLLPLLFSITCFAQTNDTALLHSRIDSLFQQEIDTTGPGCAILIQRGNDILYEKSVGLADLTTKEKFTANTVSNLGSISKTFVAYGILLLKNQGKLSLDDNILKYFPDFKNKEIAQKVKLRHLLTHTSGLPDSRNVDSDSIFYLTANDEQNFAPLKLTDTMEFELGTRWNYSNPAFNGLALIIENVSGMKWQKFIEENIFRPAGMQDSKITDGAYPSHGVAHGYRLVNGAYIEYDYGEYPTFNASGNGGVWSSINDLRKYYHAMKNASFLDKKTIALSQTLWRPEHWQDSLPPRNGFSWFVTEKTDTTNFLTVHHSGEQAGFTAMMMMVPETDVLLLFESNAVEHYALYRKIEKLLRSMGQL